MNDTGFTPAWEDDGALLERAQLRILGLVFHEPHWPFDGVSDEDAVRVDTATDPDGFFPVDWCGGSLHWVGIRWNPDGFELGEKIPTPNVELTDITGLRASYWFLRTPVPLQGAPGMLNNYRMVQSGLVYHLPDAAPIDRFPSPWEHPVAQMARVGEPNAHLVTDLRYRLREAGLKRMMPIDFNSRGGSVNSPAQQQARSRNLARAKEARKAAALDRSRRIVALADAEGAQAVIREFGLAEGSVATTVARARIRIATERPRLAVVGE